MIAIPFKGVAVIDGILPSASQIAPAVNALFYALLMTSLVMVVGLTLVTGFFLVRYRQGSNAPRGPQGIATWKFETTWITLTTLVFLGFFFWGARIYLRMADIPADAAEITVIGRQWMWEIRHPEGRRELGELHVPVGRAIRLRLTTEDVIHSFAVPAFRLKQDVVPGKTVETWFEATVPGSYPIYCDQYCGTQHAEMGGRVIVQSPADYAAWLAGSSPDDPVARGRLHFVRYGCSGCHDAGSTVRAPQLAGLAGSNAVLAGGNTAIVDDAYLRAAILDPNQQVAMGYDAVMPSYRDTLPESDVLDLVAYLKSIGAVPPAPAKP